MADQRPFGRFRLPWLSAVTAPRPEPQPQPARPTVEIVAPAQPQRPPFRPAALAQVVPPPPPAQPPSPPRAVVESQARAASVPPSPSLATAQTRVASVPPSPSRAIAQTRAPSVPPSPSRTTREGPAASQTRSPSPAAPQPRATLVPPSLTRTTTQPQPPLLAIPQRLSPFPPPASQQEPKPAVSLLEAVEKVKQAEQGKGDVEIKREGKPTGPAKEDQGFPFEERQKKEDHKTMTVGFTGEQIKTVSSTHPKPRNKLTESLQKPSMSNGEHVPLQKEIKDDITKFVHKLGIGQLKYPMDEKPVSVVTIAGENRGASMHVGSEPTRKDGSIHIHRGYKLNPDDSTGATTDGEESEKGKKSQNPTKEEPVKKAFINSNTQGINNSMVLDSSVNEESPGVHLILSHNVAEPIKPGDKSETLETHKNEFGITPAQKLTYDPSIRRRCLRGLFLESSDSDPDKPDKPRRHGCRYSCGVKGKDRDIGVL